MKKLTTFVLASLAACGGDDGTGPSEQEVITTVRLELVPINGGSTVNVAWDDPDGDSGEPPMIDNVLLMFNTTYTATVRFQNALETPPEEITDEVRDESDEHQVFFTGTGVNGPASEHAGAPVTHAYTDMDANGLPIGLANTFTTGPGGDGQLTVTLRHLPPVNGTAVKTADLASEVRAGGFAAIGGENDANVTFEVSVLTP